MGKDNVEQYPIRDGMAFGSYSFNDENFEEIKKKLSNLNPAAVGNAGTAYKEAAEVLAEMTDLLQNDYAKRIVKHWQGKVAQEALDQLGKVYKTAGQLSDDSHRNAQLYTWYKTNILDWYHTTGKTMEDGYINTDGDDDAARKLMQKFNARMNEAFEGHPLKITKDLPAGLGTGGDDPRTPGPGPGGPGGLPKGGGGGGGLSPGSSSFPTTDGAGNLPRGDSAGRFAPGGPGGSNPFAPGEVSPFNPPGGNGPHLPPGSGVDGGPFGGTPKTDLSSFPGGGGGGLPGGGAGGGFGADPGGFGGAGAGAGGGIGAGGPGAGPGLGGAGRNAAGMRGGMPMGGMPMAPGGGQGGGQNEERERNTWLTEDEDVWGADDDTAPPVIG
ncbi:hypothetical protein [Spirillospora albida]|uniref:hypothetical protein n=1 Tax=Spirillospora albida TaxID=58123 RepID=UPI00068E5797|nr:hypothetical protein [Spirillospora albida]